MIAAACAGFDWSAFWSGVWWGVGATYGFSFLAALLIAWAMWGRR